MSGWALYRVCGLLAAHPLIRSSALLLLLAVPLNAQSRVWRPEDRAFISDLWTVTAVAATRQVVYAATLTGLAIYDRAFGTWRETVGAADGLPPGIVTAMAADPTDDTAWLAGAGRWISWQPFGRRLESGPLPGTVREIVLDAQNPSSGAYYATSAGWYFVPRGGIAAQPSPPPRSPLPGAIGPTELQRLLPAFNVIRARVESDERMRRFRVTAAARVPVSSDVYVATDGNGVFHIEGVSHNPRRLYAGIAGERVTAIGIARGFICAGAMGSSRTQARGGVTCFDESLRDVITYEDRRSLRFPGSEINRVLVTERAVWAATNAGLVRADRGGSRTDVVDAAAGLPADDVHSLADDGPVVWAGTSRGLARITDTARVLDVRAVASRQPVLALAVLADTLWAGTAAGLALVAPLSEQLEPAAAAGPVNEPVIGIAMRGDTIVAITPRRLLMRAAGEWRMVEQPGRPIGVLLAMSRDTAGFWIAGTEGIALYQPGRAGWLMWDRGDVPVPARDILASRGYVWVATDLGVVRFSRQALLR